MNQSKPTFKQVYGSYDLNIDDLTGQSGLYAGTTALMLNGKPVLRQYALRVLGMLSARTGKQFTLENVDVNIMKVNSEV